MSVLVVLAIASGVALLAWALWYALDDTLARAKPDEVVVWVPMATMAAAGAPWAAVSSGRARVVRIGAGVVVGAACGALGSFAAGHRARAVSCVTHDG